MELFESAVSTTIKHVSDTEIRGGLHDKNGGLIELARHQRGAEQYHFPDEENHKASKVVKERSIYAGICFNHFGHFLVESLGRLWVSDEKGTANLPLFMNPFWGVPDIYNESNFVGQAFSILGIDRNRINFIEEPILFEKILVPEQLYGFHLIKDPPARFVSFINNARDRINGKPKVTADRVYVSRTKWDTRRGFTSGEDAFEEYLRSEGWFILYPEELEFTEQLQFYKNAHQIIFCEGSAHHALVLLPAIEAKIAIIKRNSPGWYPVSEDQLLGLGLNCIAIQRVEKQIHLGMPMYQALSLIDYYSASIDLREIGFVSRAFTEWKDVAYETTLSSVSKFLSAHIDNKQMLSYIEKNV